MWNFMPETWKCIYIFNICNEIYIKEYINIVVNENIELHMLIKCRCVPLTIILKNILFQTFLS